MTEKKLWVVRHGYRIDFNDPEWVDTAENPYNPPLAPVGFEQAEETALRLENENIDFIFASPFLRTVQTANILGAKLGVKVKMEAGLSEWISSKDFKYKPIVDNIGDLLNKYPLLDPDYVSRVEPVYPEDMNQLDRRIDKTLCGIIGEYGPNILIISHGSPINSVFRNLANLEIDGYPSMCSVSLFHYQSGDWNLKVQGDTAHLSHPDTTRKAFYSDRWENLMKK
jgi:broad specificity phosphatase PhoE